MSRRIAIWILLLIIFGASIAAAAASSGTTAAQLPVTITQDGATYTGTVIQDGTGPRVALVPISGALVDGTSSADGSATGAEDVVRMLDAIATHPKRWKGVILELNTPGGSVLASEEIAAALKRVKQAKVPVVAWMRGTAASAGYYIAASTDEIVASRHTFTGSIGVILQYFVVDELAKDVGVEAVTIKSGKLKDIGSPFRRSTPQDRELFQAIIDEAYGGFVDVVATGRGMSTERVRELADGRIYTGAQARELGLVDTLGLRRTAYDRTARLIKRGGKGEDLEVVRLSNSFGLVDLLSASTQPLLSPLADVALLRRALGGNPEAARELLGGDGSAREVGNGLARVQYRAVLG